MKIKLLKIGLPVVLALFLGLGWFSSTSSLAQQTSIQTELLEQADSSLEKGLYEQAIEQYKEAMANGVGAEAFKRIDEVYQKYLEEEPSNEVSSNYLNDMMAAVAAYPGESFFWDRAVQLAYDGSKLRDAYDLVQRALNRGVSSEVLDDYAERIAYTFSLDYDRYRTVKGGLNGYYAASDGATWSLIDDAGQTLDSGYVVVGIPNDEGNAIYVTEKDTRLLDKGGVARARFDFVASDAGCIDEETHLVPVKVGDAWHYLDLSAEELHESSYDQATSFYNGFAAVKADDVWFVIDANEKKVSPEFEDIRTDCFDACVNDGIIVAKRDGAYSLYKIDFQKTSDFSADDMDVYMGNNLIAFKTGDKWGFVDAEGHVAIEPTYADARSFASGYAAVANDEGQWGFITEENKLVIDYQFADALYFNGAEHAMVSQEPNTYQLLSFNFR